MTWPEMALCAILALVFGLPIGVGIVLLVLSMVFSSKKVSDEDTG